MKTSWLAWDRSPNKGSSYTKKADPMSHDLPSLQ